jgi:hypothetical protein
MQFNLIANARYQTPVTQFFMQYKQSLTLACLDLFVKSKRRCAEGAHKKLLRNAASFRTKMEMFSENVHVVFLHNARYHSKHSTHKKYVNILCTESMFSKSSDSTEKNEMKNGH